MPLPELSLALLALLLTPGPTNTLLAIAGAERGLRAAWSLLPLVLLAYLAMILPLVFLGAKALAHMPLLRPVIGLTAALWVAKLALTMWRVPQAQTSSDVTPARLVTTTLLNPKALIIGLVLLPAPTAILPRVAIFAALLLIASAVWAALGASLKRGGAAMPTPLRRAAALWLGILSLGLAATGLSA